MDIAFVRGITVAKGKERTRNVAPDRPRVITQVNLDDSSVLVQFFLRRAQTLRGRAQILKTS